MKIKYEVISTFAAAGLNFLDWASRFEKYNYKPEEAPAIYAIWHGLQYCLGGIPDRKNVHILISQSKDGEIIAYTVKKIGFSTVRGSMGRGGAKATREILNILEEGKNIAYTVDGPRGPGHKVKIGALRIAQMSGRPVIPVSSDSTYRKVLSTWDEYQIPLPCSKMPLVFGDPIYVPEGISEADLEEYRLRVENELFRLREDANSKV